MSYGTHQSRFKPRRKKRSPIVLLILLMGILVYLVLVGTATTTPVDALARAQEAIDNKQLESARSLLSLPLGDKRLSSWAFLLTGKLAELEGRNDAAAAQYRKIPESSAAHLDAQLGLLRLGFVNEGEFPTELLAALETKISRALRSDLREELLLTKGIEFIRNEDNLAAAAALNELRRLYPTSRYAENARGLLNEIYTKNLALSPSSSTSNALAESEILVLEDRAISALELLQKMLVAVAEKSEDYFKIRLAEERVLRKLKRHEEADHLLLVLSADAGSGVADEALFRVAKNHWNVNDQGQALTFIDSLQSRFPESPRTDEVLYTKGRILEEVDELADARDTYITLIARTSNQLLKVRSWGRVAWLYLRGENYTYAAAQFGSMRQAATEALKRLDHIPDGDNTGQNSHDERDLKLELLHAAFWEAYSLHRAEHAQVAALPYKAPNLEDLKAVLALGGAFNYYTLLARTQLKMSVSEGPTSSTEAPRCYDPENKQLVSLLEALSSGGLRSFADHEVNWLFFRSGNLSVNSASPSEEDLRHSLSRIRLLSTYGQPQTGVASAESLLRTDNNSALFNACRPALLNFAFPTPYREEFSSSSNSSSIPLPLLYAIARTESHFNPRAISSSGAQGLTQLMPSTAKQEGLAPHDDIFSPRVNVLLGAKHLRRLLEEQEQNLTHAIAAYNAGSAPINRWKTRYPGLDPLRWTEMIGYSETKDYVKKVISAQSVYEQLLSQKQGRTSAGKNPEAEE